MQKNFKNFFIIENIQPKNNNFFIEYKDDLDKLTALNINQQEAIQLMSKNVIRGVVLSCFHQKIIFMALIAK